MFWLRILSALVGMPLIILAVWYAGIPLLLLTALIIIAGLFEMMRMLSYLDLRPSLGLAVAGGLILLGGAYLYDGGYPGPTIIVVLFMHLVAVVFFYPRYSLIDGAGTLLGTLYVGLLSYFYLLRNLPDGWFWLVFMLAGTWASDTMAYFVGKTLGRKRIAPAVSPRKTVEGALGGIFGSVVSAYVFVLVYPFISLTHVLLLGLLVGIAAELGDLVESAFKRQADLKDTGNLIPGHGGVLDRFDSMLFTAPLVYYYVRLFLVK
ncbi:MAG: phosphatidate cytidylyltransferase [Peptococcaceae bacterium]|nr:MAG: phosphatidate cytidylyltransferase [Peptococcaceae bacterium]